MSNKNENTDWKNSSSVCIISTYLTIIIISLKVYEAYCNHSNDIIELLAMYSLRLVFYLQYVWQIQDAHKIACIC